MKIAIGADHRGYQVKEDIKAHEWSSDQQIEWVDVGAETIDPDDDYPDIARDLVQLIATDSEVKLGVLLCGSGAGVSIAANKFKGVRCALALNPDQVREAREHDNINVLAIAADYTNAEAAKILVEVFLGSEFSRIPKYSRRIEKIQNIENQLYK